MKYKTKHSFFKKIILSNFILLICVVMIIYFSSGLIRSFINRSKLNSQIDKLQNEIEAISEKNEQLSDIIGYLNSSDYIEEEARLKLNKKKSGENIIIVYPENASQNTSTETRDLATEKKLTYKQDKNQKNIINWLHYFFSITD